MKALLIYSDFEDDAALIGCDVAAVRAVASVESRGNGFNPEDFPLTLFEGHWFHRFTKGAYTKSHHTISYPKWTKEFYGGWQVEKERLQLAVSLDREAALKSASWGMFQIMGFNFAVAGFNSTQEFVTAMCKDHNTQLQAFSSYIVNSGLDDEMRERRWKDFARLYNGKEYWRNQYDVKLATAYAKYAKINY